MAQLIKVDPCDKLKDIIHDINNQLDKLRESDSALLLMDSAMVKLLLDSIKEIQIIEAQPRHLNTRLGYALRISNLRSEYSKARTRFYQTIKKTVEQYNRSVFTGPLVPKEDFDYITTILSDPGEMVLELDDMKFKELMKDQLHSYNEKSPKLFKMMRDELSRIMSFYDSILLVGETILYRLIREGKELRELTVNVIRDYCKTFYTQKFLTNLRHEAVRLMGGEKYTRVTPENWIDLLTNEDKLIELGKKRLALKEYQNSKADDARFEFYGEDRCKILDDSTELMDVMLSVNYGLELFDLEGALNNYNLLSALNESNQDLFCEMFLRRNVMLGMIEPELKERFEQWIQGEDACMDSLSATTDNIHAEAEELCHFIHPKLYGDDKKMNEVHNEIKGLVKNFGMQDICCHLNEMKRQERVLLPTGVQEALDELQRMGMPTDKKGYDYKTFAKYYNK